MINTDIKEEIVIDNNESDSDDAEENKLGIQGWCKVSDDVHN